MNKEFTHPLFALLLAGCIFAALSHAAAPSAESPPAPVTDSKPTTPPPPPAPLGAVAPGAGPLQIFGLSDGSGVLINGKDKSNVAIQSHLGLNGKLWVVLTQPLPLSPDKYTLFMNGSEVKGLAPAVAAPYQGPGGASMNALVFDLQRNKNNAAFWKELLGSVDGMHVPVVVSLGAASAEGQSVIQPNIVGVPLTNASFGFEVIGLGRLALALGAALAVISLVWLHARTRATLRDSLLPQIPAALQTYSLGRWQMAFWFTLIFCAFVYLFVILWDADTVTTQALYLMGISGSTALAAVAVDVAKDSPADAVNRGLQALGFKTYDDVQQVRQEIIDKQKELAALGPGDAPVPGGARHARHPRSPLEERRRQLQLEIQDRDNRLRTYSVKIQPFLTQGWFKDITTDINGTAIHRLQVVCWTAILGVVFVIDVYQNLAMPPFNEHLLLLMGISSAGYVGFKFPEVNN